MSLYCIPYRAVCLRVVIIRYICISLSHTLFTICLLACTRRPSDEIFNFTELTYFYPLLVSFLCATAIRFEVNWLLIICYNVIDAYPVIVGAIGNG